MAELQPISSEDIANAEAAAGTPFIADRFRIENNSSKKGDGGNYTVSGIFAIVTFILFIATLAILWQDFQFLSVA